MNWRRGQGLVEFALILPVLLLIILGIIEAAFIIQGYITVQHSAREAARFAVTYQPVQGECLDGILAPYPFCPRDYVVWSGEPDDQYHVRRVALIKREARRAATGLRINDAHLGDTSAEFQQYSDEPGFFGVRVWGYPSFLTDCNDPTVRDTACLDQPGLQGLPVQVLVRHNVEIVDPLYRAVVEFVPVQANTQMIKALQSYKADAGAAPSTHIWNNLQKVQRIAGGSLQSGHIPENRNMKRITFQTVRENLNDQLGYEPSSQQMADELGWDIREVGRMNSELGGEITASEAEFDFYGNSTTGANQDRALADYLYLELDDKDKVIFEHSFGYAGKPKLTNKEIALKLGTNEMAITRAKQRMGAKIRSYR
jgi:hypothetical protein